MVVNIQHISPQELRTSPKLWAALLRVRRPDGQPVALRIVDPDSNEDAVIVMVEADFSELIQNERTGTTNR